MIKTVQELIDELQKIEDKTAPIEIAIRQYNKAYPVTYTEIFKSINYNGNKYRLYTSLPWGAYTVGIKE